MKVTRWRIIGAATAVLVVVLIVWGVVSSQTVDGPRTVIAKRGTVTQDVTFTGQLEAVRSAALSFETTGTISQVLVEIGDEVSEGDALAADTMSASKPSIKYWLRWMALSSPTT